MKIKLVANFQQMEIDTDGNVLSEEDKDMLRDALEFLNELADKANITTAGAPSVQNVAKADLATEKQIKYLNGLGVKYNPNTCTKEQARKLIAEAKANE